MKKLWMQLVIYSFFCGIVSVGFTAVVYAALSIYTVWDRALCLFLAASVGAVFAALGSLLVTRFALIPLRAIEQTIAHLSQNPDEPTAPPVRLEDIHSGREVVSQLTERIYSLAGGYSLSKNNQNSKSKN